MSVPETFADLQIRVLPLEASGYPIEITLDEQRQFPRGHLDPAFLPWIPSASPETDGERLFDWLLQDDALKSAWAETRGAYPQRRVRLRIDADAPELHAIPWELIREPADGGPAVTLAAADSTPFSRYLAGVWDPGEAVRERPLKIAVAIANPDNLEQYRLTPVDADSEWRGLEEAMAGLDVALERIPQPCTLARLEEAIQQGCHILHFVGHGAKSREDESTVLFLADEQNQVQLAGDDRIAEMVARHLRGKEPGLHEGLRLVYLSSCQTAVASPADAFRGLAPKLVQAGAPAVVAMQDLVPVPTAQAFSQVFYRQLLAHGVVDLAANQARGAALTADLSGAAIPVLFMRLNDGRLLEPRVSVWRKRWPALAIVAALALVLALALAFVLGPAQMDASARFRVAVAPVAALDDAGDPSRNDLTALIDDWIIAELESASQPFNEGDAIQLWHDKLPITAKRIRLGPIAGATPDERAQAAAALAQRVNAQVVIYGRLQPADSPKELVVEFYVAPDLARAEADLAIGRYQLGDPIPLGNIDPDSFTANEALARRVTSRTNGLFWMLLILREQLLGRPGETLAIFEQIQPELSEWKEQGEGKETLYAFLGDAALALGDFEQATAFYDQALASNPRFARAQIGLGSVAFARAQMLAPAERLNEPHFLEQALDHHRRALALAQDQAEARLEHIASLALAKDLRVQGETRYALGDFPAALAAYDDAIQQLERVIPPLQADEQYRLLAQAYESEGTAYLQQADAYRRSGDEQRSLAGFKSSANAYSACIAAAQAAPDDAYLQDQIADATCRPMQALAIQQQLNLEQGG